MNTNSEGRLVAGGAELLAVLPALRDVAREEILRHYRRDSCIASTRIIIAVLARFSIEAEPLPVRVIVNNRASDLLVGLLRRTPQSQAEVEEWFRLNGAHSVGLGYGSNDPAARGWDGHLVAWISGHGFIDASIDQADRPQHDIALPGLLFVPATRRFRKGRGPVLARAPNGEVLRYDAMPRADGYTSAPDWRRPSDAPCVGAVVGNIVRLVEERMPRRREAGVPSRAA